MTLLNNLPPSGREAGPDQAREELILKHLSFVENIARRTAASISRSVDLRDLVQDGAVGLIDALRRFDEARGVKFEAFAGRRVQGAMIDALRREAWPRDMRRQRHKFEAAREALRLELGHEPSMSDLAARVGFTKKRLKLMIVRINTIESTSPFLSGDSVDRVNLPAGFIPSEPESPDVAYQKAEMCERIREAITYLPPRERKLIDLYYYQEATMKQIGKDLGVKESRVSQLHARAIWRMRQTLKAGIALA